MLKLEGHGCGYGAITATSGVSFEVPKGRTLALLGPNGAGKTSTIMSIMGHVQTKAGRILFEDRDIAQRPPIARVKLGMALVPEGRQIFPDLTVDENLVVGGYSLPKAREDINRQRVFELFPRLAERHRQDAGLLSGGEQQMLALGRALMAEPRFLLVDELSLGLMPKMVDVCFGALATLKELGLTILLVEQNTTRALEVADLVCVLASGRQVFFGEAHEVRKDGNLFETYLGATA